MSEALLLVRNETFYADPGPAYDVLLGGEKVGTVYKGMCTFERGPRQARYVTRRWQSPRWFADVRNRPDRTTRRMAIADVLASRDDHRLPMYEYEDQAKAAAVVRAETAGRD